MRCLENVKKKVFTELAQLGRFSHRVAMSVYLCVCAIGSSFFLGLSYYRFWTLRNVTFSQKFKTDRPTNQPSENQPNTRLLELLEQLKRVLLVLLFFIPPIFCFFFHGNDETIHIRQEIHCLLYAGFSLQNCPNLTRDN